MKLIYTGILILCFYSVGFCQSATQYIDLGKKQLSERNITEAIGSFNKAIKLEPKNETAYISKAICYMSQGNWKTVIPICTKVIAINPKQAIAYFIRGSAKMNTDQSGCNDFKKSETLGYTMASKAIQKYCN